MKIVKIKNCYVNLEHIEIIYLSVKGRDCGAPFQQSNELFTVVEMSSGRKLRFKHGTLEELALCNKLGIDLCVDEKKIDDEDLDLEFDDE